MFLNLEDEPKKYAILLLLLFPIFLCYMLLASKDLYAEAQIRNLRYDYSYSLTLNKNGGTGGTDTVIISLDENGYYCFDKMTIQIPTRPGFIFSGYAVLANNFDDEFYIQNMVYDANGELITYNYLFRDSIPSFQPMENQTIYALWAKPLTITFDKNGGAGGSDSVTMMLDSGNHLYKSWLELPAISAPSIEGQQFLGYCYDQNLKKESMTYWANSTGSQYHWDGTLLNQNLIYPDAPYGSKFRLAITADGILEYKFYDFEINDWKVIDSDITFYALWRSNGLVTINLNMNEADNWHGESRFVVSSHMQESNVPHLAWPKKAGYIFAGFYDEPNGQGNAWAHSYIYESQKSIYWTGIWTAKGDSEITLYPYFVKSDPKFNFSIYLDNQGSEDFFIYINGLENILPIIQLPEKTGFSFMGYFEQPNGVGSRYINADGTPNKFWDKEEIFFSANPYGGSNARLYAYWLPISNSEYFKLLQSIENLVESDYTSESWKIFKEALNNVNLNLSLNNSKSELNNAVFKIHSSFSLLEKNEGDYSYYHELLAYGRSLMKNTSENQFKYTSESLDNFRWRFGDYLNQKPILSNQKQSKIDSEVKLIKSYLAMLKEQPARFKDVYESYKKRIVMLQEIIEEITVTELYENGSWHQTFYHPNYTKQSIALFHAYINYVDPIYFGLDASNSSLLVLEAQIDKIDKTLRILVSEYNNESYEEYSHLLKKVKNVQEKNYSKSSFAEFSKIINEANLNLNPSDNPLELNNEIVLIQSALKVLEPNALRIWMSVTPIIILSVVALLFWVKRNKTKRFNKTQ